MFKLKPGLSTFCFLLISLIYSACSLAQDKWLIQGKVLEQDKLNIIAGAMVYLTDATEKSVLSDENGEFTLRVDRAGLYRVSAKADGFVSAEPVSIKLQENSPPLAITIHLVADVVLPDVVVTAESEENRVSKTVITGQELEQVAGTSGDPLKAIQSLPGVAMVNDATGAPAIRGTSPGDNAYIADDLPIGYLFHAGGFASVFHTDLVRDFNIYASAFGPEQPDVIGAVLDVNLRQPRVDRIGSKFTISLIGADALVEGPITENQSFYLAGRRSYFDFVVKEINDREEGFTFRIPRYWDYQGKYLWHLNDDHSLSAYATGARDTFSFSIDADSETADEQPDLVGNSEFSMRYNQQALVLESNIGDESNNKLILGHMLQGQDSTLGSAGNVDFSQDNYYIQNKFNVPLNAYHKLLLDLEYWSLNIDLDVDFRNTRCTEFDVDCDLSSAERETLVDDFWVNYQALAIKDRWRLGEHWTLIPGVRFSSEDMLDKESTDPRLGLEWDYNANTLLTFGWGKHHQFPQGAQVVEEFGNPALGYLRSEHVVLGMDQKLEQGWKWKLETYYKEFSDFIVADPVVNYTNDGSGWAYGTELLVKKSQTDDLSGWLALTYSRSLRKNNVTGETFAFAFDQPWIAVTAMTWRFTSRLSLSWKWSYHTGTPYTPVLGTAGTFSDGRPRPVYGRINSARLPNYHRLDVRLDYDHPYSDWKLNTFFEVINAYNRLNVAGYEYNADYTEREPVYQLPLIPSFGVQAVF